MTGFTDERIVSFLENHSPQAGKAYREILARKDEFVPLLLDVQDRFTSEKDPYGWFGMDILIPASMLLAQMRITKEKDNDDGGNSLHKNEKFGRNDPCPCGSGKKYKRRHGH